ncbi:hypothetical protein K440DRAFT_658267 [Wilcoxina mikolae CBS 423.85]|nr:hypothetical protein K440DRAFT_658267 [Wilcoxina mikolae CBS 423.85]
MGSNPLKNPASRDVHANRTPTPRAGDGGSQKVTYVIHAQDWPVCMTAPVITPQVRACLRLNLGACCPAICLFGKDIKCLLPYVEGKEKTQASQLPPLTAAGFGRHNHSEPYLTATALVLACVVERCSIPPGYPTSSTTAPTSRARRGPRKPKWRNADRLGVEYSASSAAAAATITRSFVCVGFSKVYICDDLATQGPNSSIDRTGQPWIYPVAKT